MAAVSLTAMAKPPKRYRPSRRTDAKNGKIRFETKREARLEDDKRIRLILKDWNDRCRKDRRDKALAVKRLTSRIRTSNSGASSLYMRKQRNRISGHLWRLVAASTVDVSAFTLIPRSWEFSGGELHLADPVRLLGKLRQALIRAGALRKDGWLFAAIHGEYEPGDDVFRLHVHGVESGDFADAIDGLRTQRDFRSPRTAANAGKVYRRVRITRKPLENLPEPITYLLQGFWPEKAIFETKPDVWERHNRKRRIKGARHTEVLEWLDRWPLSQRCLMMGLRVGRTGLRHRKCTPIDRQ